MAAWGSKIPERYKKSTNIVIWPGNAKAFEVFRRCSAQWRYLTPPMGKPVPLGLESTQVESTMRMLGIDDQLETLNKIQHIEAGALEVMRR